MWLPIPFVGHFSLSKTGQIRFPACALVAGADRLLSILFWISLLGGFVPAIVRKDDDSIGYIIFAGIFGAILVRILQWLLLRRVKVVRIGMSSLEVRFAWQSYALEFCRLNDLGWRDHPSHKRMMPIMVNDVR